MTHPVNPFSVITPNIAVGKIVDRRDELDGLRDSLINRRENALVVGDYGVGKTCLLRKLRAELSELHGRTLLFAEMDHETLAQGAGQFLRNSVLRLFAAAWEHVFGRPAMELLNALRGEISVEERLQARLHSFLELFRLARPDATKLLAARSNEAGATFVATAKVSESFTAARDLNQLSSPEFLEIATELLRFVAADGVTHVIIFGDEANHIETETEVDIIRQNLEAFSARNVQFVFTFKKGATSTPAIKDAFAYIADVRPFRTSKEVRLLFDTVGLCDECSTVHVRFEDPIVQRLYRATNGHPRQVQLLAQRLWQRATVANKDSVDMTNFVDTLMEFYEFSPR